MIVIVGLGVGSLICERKLDAKKKVDSLTKAKSNEILPYTKTELRLFIILTFLIGIGWELLYRRFLLLALSPICGITAPIIISALAYGLAHGYKDPRQLAASIASAFAFTLGFAPTKSLWWLMLLHVGLPLLGAISCYNMSIQRAVATL